MNETDIFELQASVCRTFANPTRLKILAMLETREMTVGEMAAAVGAALPNVSQHLAVLRSQDLVLSRRDGQTIYYRLADRRILRACGLIRAVLLGRMRKRGEVARRIGGATAAAEK